MAEVAGEEIVAGHLSGGAAAAVAALREAVDNGTTPGGVLVAGWGKETEFLFPYGWAQTAPPNERRPMSRGTAFDLASLTKVMATLPVVLRLLADGRINLGSKVAELLPGFGADSAEGAESAEGAGTVEPSEAVPRGEAVGQAAAGRGAERAEVTVENLLTHTSGLPAHREYWRLGLGPDELKRRFLQEPLELEPGTRPGDKVRYSDIGFMLLGWLAEAVTGRRLAALVSEWVTEPLGLARTSFWPRPAGEAAATEMGRDGRYIVGVVHDENAAALVAPVGHAGLFSVAEDLAAYAGAWVSGTDEWIRRDWRDEAVKDRTAAALDGHRGLGWVARGDAFDPLGEAWPATAVSHTGFTGTSLAFDPPSGRWVALLTNDVHFGRGRGTIKALRREVHGALAP